MGLTHPLGLSPSPRSPRSDRGKPLRHPHPPLIHPRARSRRPPPALCTPWLSPRPPPCLLRRHPSSATYVKRVPISSSPRARTIQDFIENNHPAAMETQLSTGRITQKSAAAAPDMTYSRSKKSAAKGGGDDPRAALHDITNDSPIVGVHAADRTPQASAAGAKNCPRNRYTPGSGEALLRVQFKTLLQKVDEEGAAAATIIRPVRVHALLGVTRSPTHILAPTPFNTPHICAYSAGHGGSALPDGRTVLPCVLEREELIPKL